MKSSTPNLGMWDGGNGGNLLKGCLVQLVDQKKPDFPQVRNILEEIN